MINRYELSSPKLQEEIFIEYVNGSLSSVLLPIKHPLKAISFTALFETLPQEEKHLPILATINLTVTKEIPKNIKIAMWCEKYMLYHDNEKYKVTQAEGKRIGDFKLTAELLDHYFTSSNFLFIGKHSIFNFTKYYNELVADFNNKGKKKHPNHYSREYANKLHPSELPNYWKHLRSLGLVEQKDRIGNLTDWIKKV